MSETIHVLKNRRILQVPIDEGPLPSSDIAPGPILRPENVSSGGTAAAKTTSTRFIHTTPFDSSMVLTVLVLLTALFFMGFFSLYIRRFAHEDPSDLRRRRHSPPPALIRRNRKHGVDSSTVKSLPTVPYRGGANQVITDCSICLSEFEVGETVKLIPYCRHMFHSPCLDTWLASHVSCPLCRGAQFFKAEGEPDRDEVEVRLDVAAEEGGGSGRPAVDGCDTSRVDANHAMTRAGSCTNLGDYPAVLHRSFSF